MSHYFAVSNSKSSKVFLPHDSVLKEENNPPAASSAPTHSYNLRTKDELKKQREEAATRQENQNRLPGKGFDMLEIDVEEQKRLYEEAQRASKKYSKVSLKTIQLFIPVHTSIKKNKNNN